MASDKTTALREAIRQVLARATAPMTPGDICSQPEVTALGYERYGATLAVAHTFLLKGRGWPMMRLPGTGRNGSLYFNPDVLGDSVDLALAEQAAPMGTSEKVVAVNTVNVAPSDGATSTLKATDFQFDPIGFDAEASRTTKAAGRKPGTKNRAPYGSLKKASAERDRAKHYEPTTGAASAIERLKAIGKVGEVNVPAVQVPAGVKCITLSVAGVSIKIELG